MAGCILLMLSMKNYTKKTASKKKNTSAKSGD